MATRPPQQLRVHNMLQKCWMGVAGLIAGLLLARLTALLLAARPDHPVVWSVLTLTAPLTTPFRALDRLAAQPSEGARLELATIAALLLVLGVSVALAWHHHRRLDRAQPGEHYAQSQRSDR